MVSGMDIYSDSAVIKVIVCLLSAFVIQECVESSTIGGAITFNTNLTLEGSPYRVSKDLVVSDNVTLTIEPGVQLHFFPGVKLQVKGFLRAHGNATDKIVLKKDPGISGNSSLHHGIRLYPYSHQRPKAGRLEIFLNGRWGTVCNSGWNIRDTQVACRQLGFAGALRYSYRWYWGSGMPIWLNDVHCFGNETNLLECSHQGNSSHHCGNWRIVWIECHGPYLSWKGLEFSTSYKPLSLRYIHISDAQNAIKGGEFLPNLYDLTISSCVYGVVSPKMRSSLTVKNSRVWENIMAGIHIQSGPVNTSIENTVVEDIQNGGGLYYSGLHSSPIDFCSVNEGNITFPVTFLAVGNSSENVSCAKTIRTAPREHLTIHYEVMTGENFELEVHDGNNVNASIVTVVNASSGVNQAVLPATSSGHEFYISFRYTGRMGTSVKFLITDDKVLSSLMLSNVTFTNNFGRGVTLSNITGHIAISNALVYKNRADGVSGMRIFGTVTTSYLHLFDNQGEGLRIENSSFLTCDFHNLFAKENSLNGFHLQDVSLKCNIENAKFDSNGYNGLEVDRGAGNIGMQNATAILNGKGGVRFVNGKASSRLVSCVLSRNKGVGCYIGNQGGSHQLSNSSINYNLQDGVVVFETNPYYWDTERHFHLTDAFSMVNCVTKSNGHYGVLIASKCYRLRESFVDVAMKIAIFDNQIQRNEMGGVWLRLCLSSRLWYEEKEKTRKILAVVSGNVFQENKRSAFLMETRHHLHIMDAVIASNHFINNSNAVFALKAGDRCLRDKKPSKPLQIKNNVFTNNRVTGNVMSVDVQECWYSEARRSVAIFNNTFEDNQLTTKDRFPSFYHRTTSRAVLVLKRGSFILHENTFENHAFSFETSTLHHDPGHVIDARFNWWGSTNECDIADRIFDYRRRAQLSLLEFFPYMVSKNKSLLMNLTILRPSCFLRNRTIGGILDRPLHLPSEDNGYEVRDDIMILTNDSLVIPGNTTLYFPSRSVMVAQGSLIVDGHETAKVKFVKKNPTKSFRLASGPGPWEGRIEFLINGTWMPMCFPHNQSSHEEASVVCQQLDLYYQRSYVKPSIKSAGGFVYNVECKSHIDADIMSCNREKWSYQTTCWENNVYVNCRQYTWAGLHLTVSKYHSTLHHLEIHDAGFAYRSDIYVPGVALRIDLNHHNISNVYINGSDGVGIQFLYQSVFQRMPMMTQSVVSHTKLHGIHTFYPLSLTDVDLMSNDIGFLFTILSYYEMRFSFTMASPGMTQTFHFCSKNKTYLEANRLFVFTLEALKDFKERNCFHILQTEPGYKLVFQDLYFPLFSFMTVYDGLNISAKLLWTVWQSSYWNVRPLFNSSRSVVLFRGRYRGYYGIRSYTNFLVSTIKESESIDNTGGGINVAQMKISNSASGGIEIQDYGLSSVSITDTTISDSQGFGIKISQGRWSLRTSSLVVDLQNCSINGSRTHGLFISNWLMPSIVTIQNSSIARNGYEGLEFNGRSLTLLASDNSYTSNKKGAITLFQSDWSRSVIKLDSNTFFDNEGTTVLVNSTSENSLIFLIVNNVFKGNRGFASVLYHSAYSSSLLYRNKVVFEKNSFSENTFAENGALVMRGYGGYDFAMEQNTFLSNVGRCVLLESPTLHSVDVSVRDNMFTQNDCNCISLVEVQPMNGDINITNNTFERNSAQSIVLLRMIRNVNISSTNAELVFSYNTLSNNLANKNSHKYDDEELCVVILFGLLSHQNVGFRYNRFNNTRFSSEICVRVQANSWRDIVNVTHNWWGTSNVSEVRNRISDFDDNYDFAIAEYWPFLLSHDDLISVSQVHHERKLHGRVLSGRLFESLTLKASQSPYHVTTDLTVLDNVSLTIEPGVKIKINPGVSILIAGRIRAIGTASKRIIFTVQVSEFSAANVENQIRLVGGPFPWYGMLQIFKENSWKPVAATRYYYLLLFRVCKHLGYGPPIAFLLRDITVNDSTPVELHCHGNETSLHECSIKQLNPPFNNISLLGVYCRGKSWGNIRFVSSRDLNVSMEPSTLKHVEFSHCGNRHGRKVYAVEAVINVPEVNFITVKNCIGGGLGVYFTKNPLRVKNSEFTMLYGSGIYFFPSGQNIEVEDTKFINNFKGISIVKSDNIPRVYYGRMFLCDEENNLVQNKTILYFEVPFMTIYPTLVTCEKVLNVHYGQGIKITLLYFKGTQRVKIYGFFAGYLILDRSSTRLSHLLHKDLFVPCDSISIHWTGHSNSQVVFKVEEIDIIDLPCTFDLGLCTWHTFSNMSVDGHNITTTWKILAEHSWPLNWGDDYSYLSPNGKRLSLTGNDHLDAHGAIISPLITKHSPFCSLVFFYQQGNDSALLSTYIQTGTYPEVKQKRIWRGKQGEKEGTWVKVQIALPADLDEYRVLLHGKVNKSLHNHSANYLSIDNLELLGCSKREHRISNSVFSGHFREAITYISKTVQSRQTSIAIERCKIVNSNVAIFIDIRDSDFTLAHNLISGNHEFAFAATLRVSQGTVSSKGLIYRNTISGNNKGIMVKQEERSKDDPVFLYILENAFENNNNYYYYYHWSQFQVGLLKLLNIPCWIKNNVFFNNSDFIVMESTFQGPFSKGQQCEMNTFYLNRGPGKFSGTCAVLSDGQMSYHRNNFKNPAFLYEFCATNATDKIQAEMNWWGVDQESEVALRIHDREDFHHLSAVIHKPFQKLPPKGILSRGCPPGWINQDSICAVLRGGSETFKEARDYCEYYGGHIASTTDPADLKIAYARIEPSSIYGSPAVPIWVTNGEASQGDVGNREQQCTVITQNGTQKIVPCNGLHPFICIRKAVNRCPNSCFHNGDCVGATCFCRRGWTGEDCSQFHCRDVHNCSRRGQCLGPNLCKCQRGYAGRGCTYSYCTKFHRCSTCSRGDSACGWCDSLEKCMPGTPKGPYSYNCPDWFYYHCYTVGSSSRCSHTIQRVDCANRQCNLAQDTSDKETCQKCHDLENCFNYVEQRKCRAWNETQCPLGLVKVDYKDTKRIENTMIRSNVKVINPDIATIYRCPTSPDMDDRMSVFVAPRSLGIKIGDVLSSPQAGGLMHKVNETTNTGPYTMILGLEAGIEELIQYADFTQNVSAVEITDQATVDEEPYLNDLYGLIEGNVTLNSSDLHILQSDTPVFKCVGHLYKVGDELVPTQFLVISKDHAFVAKPEDVIISTHSHGFIEKVTKVSHVSDLMFLETELERCTENSTWVQRFKSHLSGDLHNDNVTCTGGDNSLSLITFEPDNEKHKNVSVNDVIVGRNSNPILAKVIEMKTNGNYVLIEVLPVTFIANGTAFTSVRFDQLRKEHRRQKRDIEHMKNEFHQTYTLPRWKMPLFGGSYTTVQVTIKVNADFTLSFGIQTRRDKNGDLVSRDPLFGMEIGGQIIFEADMETVIKKSVDFFKTTRPLLHSPVQLGPVFWIPIGGVGVPCAFFFTANLVSSIKAEGKVSIQSTLTVSGKTRLGGHCTFSGGCQKIQPRFDVDSNFNLGRVEAQTGCSIEVQVSPNLSLKMPTKPKWLRKAIKKVKQLWKKVFNFFGFKSKTKQKKSDWSLIQLSIETPFGMRAKLTLCSSYCAGKDELLFHAGFSEVVGKLFVGFTSKKHEIVAASWPLNWDTTKRVCLDPSCKKSKPGCSCPTTPSPTTPALTTPSTTQPPTTPPPCDCTKEEEAIIGPDESCTCLPKCKDGSKHVLVNKRYECPEYPLCGKYPNCVLGRKGPFCSQPDVPGCPYGCSGNGVIVPLSDCTAQCRCSTRWTGTCCQRRLPWRNWGDPHLETLDGIEFDYFGIGEFWGCKSIFNDFGIQFRYFAYQRASLTGGVAVKLGQSVLTIMSLKSINPQEYPKLRIDGELVNISAHTGQKMRLDNGSVIMEMQKAFNNSSEEAAVMLVSLQFESGLTLTTDVRYSHMMNRQFLNVFFTPTLAFKGYTEGLCGVMDDDQSNDLMGPNKKQYDDPIKFADSWRISTSHNNSSLRGTWSWNASNFHRDDVMDSSYTNPNFVPMYSLEGIDSFIIAKAKAACSSLGLSNSMLKSCVYDVSVTNDTSLTAQETFQEGCPGQCSGKGRCVNSTCQCMTGWAGESCQMGDCSNCSTEHGTCIKGFCECDDGWEGDTCDKKATCHSLHNCTSPKNGVCRRTDQCRCFDGYIGIDCSMVPTCYNVSNCSARGICIDYDVCKCQKDWTGENCTQFSCASLDHCSGQGSCIALYECACYPGWTGDSCALPDCAGVNRCSGHGECVSSNTCQCYPGFQGVNCSDIADCSTLGNCNGNGVCMQDSAGNLTCRCFAGFSGLNCSTPICLSVNNCSGHGICVEADFCTCDEGYTGIDCANVSCEAINYCSGHGVCVAFDTCTCDSTWHGASCSLANCSGVNECSGKGDCILPNTCECFPGYDGVACNMTASPNLHAPIFSTPFYNLTLSENVPINTHILKVNASDADTGRNAQLFFLLDNSDGVNSAFTIDSSSGKIFTLMNFDYEGSSPKFLKLKIMVLDDGVPRKSGFAFVYITIRDENDNCPVFNSTKAKSFNISQNAPPGTLLTTVAADDIDSGLNGEVRYSVSYASINERAFAVDEKSGEVTILNGLTERSYRFVVTARDLGVPSCSRQIELTVDVFQEPQTITVTSGITTEESRTSDPVASTTNPSSDVASPTNSSSDVPMSLQPQTSKWYTKPLVIIGMSLGFVFLVVLLVILFIAQKKRQTHPKPNDKTQESRDNEALEMDTVL